MIRKTTNTIKHHVRQRGAALLKLATLERSIQLTPHDVANARSYIEQFWVNLERYNPKDQDTLIGLPHPYLVPAHDPSSNFNFDEMYYWDSYFMVQGFLRDRSKKDLVLGILDNMFTMLSRFRMVPNASRTYLMSRSQPPLLTSFIFDVYEAYSLDARWLANAIGYAKGEYETVWMGTQKPFWHLTYKGLSRYYDINALHDLAEAESGWDMTTRFDRRALDFLPVDLNAYLYKYEMDFARAAHILGEYVEQVEWEVRAKKRQKTMISLMWNETKKIFFDYDYMKKKQGTVQSLAAYTALFTGVATKTQAAMLVKKLKYFMAAGGLVTSYEPQLGSKNTTERIPVQWAYPNGWAPLHFMVVKGLEKYGYEKEAEKIALLWLRANNDWFLHKGVFLEKYNVVQPQLLPVEGVYPTQSGFGWTNAVFERFCQDYLDRHE